MRSGLLVVGAQLLIVGCDRGEYKTLGELQAEGVIRRPTPAEARVLLRHAIEDSIYNARNRHAGKALLDSIVDQMMRRDPDWMDSTRVRVLSNSEGSDEEDNGW